MGDLSRTCSTMCPSLHGGSTFSFGPSGSISSVSGPSVSSRMTSYGGPSVSASVPHPAVPLGPFFPMNAAELVAGDSGRGVPAATVGTYQKRISREQLQANGQLVQMQMFND